MEKVKVGITCEEYKIEPFKKELKEKGFDEVETFKLSRGVFLLKVITQREHVETVRRLCVKMQHQFKRGTN